MYREDLTAIICYDVRAILRIYQDVEDVNFTNADDLLCLRTMPGGSLDAGMSFSFFPQGRKQVGVSGTMRVP